MFELKGKLLVSVEKAERDKEHRRLESHLTQPRDLTEMDYMKIWKGLFYCKPRASMPPIGSRTW